MKKLFKMLSLLCMVCLLSACAGQDKSSENGNEEEKKYTIGIAYAGYEEYHVNWEKYAKKWIEENYGDNVEINVI